MHFSHFCNGTAQTPFNSVFRYRRKDSFEVNPLCSLSLSLLWPKLLLSFGIFFFFCFFSAFVCEATFSVRRLHILYTCTALYLVPRSVADSIAPHTLLSAICPCKFIWTFPLCLRPDPPPLPFPSCRSLYDITPRPGTWSHTCPIVTKHSEFECRTKCIDPLRYSGNYMYRTVVTICTAQW